MIDLLLAYAGETGCEKAFLNTLSAHITDVEHSAGAGDRQQVAQVEAELQAQPEEMFQFDRDGNGILRAGRTYFPVGRFEAVSIGDLQRRAGEARKKVFGGRIRLSILAGALPATDIGSLAIPDGRHSCRCTQGIAAALSIQRFRIVILPSKRADTVW